MKKLFKFTLGIMFALTMGVFFSACGEDSKKQEVSALERIKQRQEVFIGVFGDKPPFGYIDSQGENAGFDVILAKRITKDLLGDEKKAKFIVVEAANRVEFLRSNKVDIIMANFTKTPEREKVVDFAKPYMKVSLGVVSKNGAIEDIKELEDKTLIVNKGTTADFYFSKNFPNLKILKFEQNTEAFSALKDGRGDALAHDNTLLFAWAKENPSFKVGIKELGENDVIAPAVKKDNKELLEWLDSEISALIEEGFLLQAYESTLAPAYSDEIHASDVVF